MSEFTTRVAVVTGGGSGIGKAVAIALAEAGAAVGVVDWNRANAERVAADLCGRGLRALAAVADVADEPAVKTAFATIVEAFGDIDILFNNAGIDNAVPLVDMSAAVWDEMMRVNLRSLFVCTKAVLPAMQRKRWGRIINTASQSGYKGAPAMVHYCATKAGVLGFTRALAYEVIDDNITVNAIAPGPIDTPIKDTLPPEWVAAKVAGLPIKRFGTVDEVAPAVMLLASDAGAYFVGACLNMNGGDHMA
ncbi:SDR family oxidoreductase [Lichenihabitans sp. PAMC28606]|uniref:SDR family NAD(P)-dependent oxidoreductase n=1 Tax=Lichenihabitans sp. PAMC28606 TaxID=2880932 RepID=UPI001D0AB379|nr:SDR family NAD(P)-dependent oxidoreductase [Lichenihabitans sp. PAMC28606]UDL94744.1 SDR family oxidoreductase [Lichenihabitans sp. PAMC28606]